VPAIVWGRTHESVAFQKFEEVFGEKYGAHFQDSGE